MERIVDSKVRRAWQDSATASFLCVDLFPIQSRALVWKVEVLLVPRWSDSWCYLQDHSQCRTS